MKYISAEIAATINRPLATMFGKSLYEDIFERAVALFESIAKNHVFHNANKRTAFSTYDTKQLYTILVT